MSCLNDLIKTHSLLVEPCQLATDTFNYNTTEFICLEQPSQTAGTAQRALRPEMRISLRRAVLCVSGLLIIGVIFVFTASRQKPPPPLQPPPPPQTTALRCSLPWTCTEGDFHALECPPGQFLAPPSRDSDLLRCRPQLDCIEIARDVTQRTPLAVGGVKTIST